MYYVNCFFVYSVFGFLFESMISIFRKTGFSSGILYGPWTPIYGIGVDLILVISKYFFSHLYLAKWREISIVLLILIVVLTLIEWVGGILIEKFFHVVFWNYENFDYHIGKYIALEVSFFWGFLSLILIYVIHPFFNSFIIRIPFVISCILIVLMFCDYIFTFLKYKSMSNN